MPPPKRLLSYLTVFALAAAIGGLGYRLSNWGYDVLGCTLNSKPGTFLAYCTSAQYGDYEHGAFYFDLEPEAVRNLQRARVLFLGSSRLQYGFSTEAVKTYFAARSIPFYLMGFGYADGVEFALDLIEKYDLAPDFLVIDTNPFFTSFRSAPGHQTSEQDEPGWLRPFARLPAWWDYLNKKAFNALQPSICRLGLMTCGATFRTIYRSVENGFWLLDGFEPADAPEMPLTAKKLVHLDKHPLPADLGNAQRLLAALRLPQNCIVLTAAPSNALDVEPYATEIARLLGLRLLLPNVDGIGLIDPSHLSRRGAEHWSGTIMSEIDPLLPPCLTRNSAMLP